jgi:hypothetical protein
LEKALYYSFMGEYFSAGRSMLWIATMA